MEIDCKAEAGAVTLLLKGRLGATDAPDLDTKLKEIFPQVKEMLVLDCSGLVYISSGGLRVILLWAKQLRTAGKGFKLVNVNSDVYKILTLSGFTTIIDCSRQEGP